MSGHLDFGVGLFPTENARTIVELARLADEVGYATVWVGDSHLIWREAFVTLGAAAMQTSRIRLASGVTNAITRHPTVLASAFYALDELSGGRAVVGIGLGDSSVRTMGLTPIGLRHLEHVVSEMRRLFGGKDTGYGGARLLAAQDTPRQIPITIAGSGPRLLELAGRIADGAIVLVGVDEHYVRAGVEAVRRGANLAGRDAGSLRIVLWCPCALSSDRSAISAVKAHVARVIIRPLPTALMPEDAEVAQRIKASYNYYQHMDVSSAHGQLVPDEMVPRFALSGRPEDIAARVRSLAGLGINEVAIIPYPTAEFDRETVVRVFAEHIVPRTGPAQ